MLFLLFSLSRSEYKEILLNEFDSLIGGSQPVFVKYYSPKCPHCKAMAQDYLDASKMFNITFGAFDCLNNKEKCTEKGIDGWPTLQFYPAGDQKGIKYDGDRSADSMADFIEQQTSIKANRPPRVLQELNSITLKEVISGPKCAFITFYSPTCTHSKRFLPGVRAAAVAYKEDEKVTIGALNCVKFDSTCNEENITGFPTARVYKNGNFIKMTGPRSQEAVFNFIGEQCGSSRGFDGLPDDFEGTVDGAYEIAQEYIQPNADRKMIREKMAKIPGTEFYLKVMDRIDQKGVESITNDILIMRKFLEEKSSSSSSLDEMKRRYNVFTEFEKLPSLTKIKNMNEGAEKIRLTKKFYALNPVQDDSNEPSSKAEL